ncbi:Cinnamyl alcohol dehydrogenase 8 [Citrus sinensis]|uniref:Cinnamyl alcohol dehydrogenase 8 n=1 Tax=Citrus sinensis TaxID=2711 RepID=A0ACB8J5A4_CITSI|nr:Cinnamyl alcohol dehydrogenase 8 [Citrus sinensis]
MAEKSLSGQVQQKKASGWAARDTCGVLSPFDFYRRVTGEKDVTIKVLYCGICRSDLHMLKNDWGISTYPLVPGHEVIGVVTEVGSKVEKFKVGDKVGAGFLVGSCHSCHNCANNFENYCPKLIGIDSGHFTVRIPDSLPLDACAPMLCAGISVYSPLRSHGLDKPGMHVGVVGLGGLGHMAVKFAKAMGVKVTVISTSPSKKKDAIERLGADTFLFSHDPDEMQSAVSTLDGIIDTVTGFHPLLPLLGLLKYNGKLVIVGGPDKLELPVPPLLFGAKAVVGCFVGGMKETQDMLNFAAEHNITADIETISIDNANTALERLEKGDVRYRFVIDVGNTLKSSS